MERFVKDIRPSLPNCPSITIKRNVLSKAIEFCRQTSIWSQTEQYTATGDETTVTLSPPAGSRVFRAEVTRNGYPCLTFDLGSNQIVFDVALVLNEEIAVKEFLVPTRDATALPDILYNDYFEGIKQGALSSLMLIPNKEWSNPELATVCLQDFMYYVTEAKIAAIRRNPKVTLYMDLTAR